MPSLKDNLMSVQTLSSNVNPTDILLEHAPVKAHYANIYQQKTVHAISTDFPENSIAKNALPPSIISNPGSQHGLAAAIAQAYSLHQHLRLRPDDIWLTIAQGVSQHAKLHPDKFRNYWAEFKDEQAFSILAGDILVHSSNGTISGDWPEAISRLINVTDKNMAKLGLKKVLECDFSTTTSESFTASQIILFNMPESHSQFKVGSLCEIQKVTLEGSWADWLHLQEKVGYLRQLSLDLDFWLDKLEPVVAQLIATYSGQVNQEFWGRVIATEQLGRRPSESWDGWITALFPYDKRGKKMEGTSINPHDLPSGRVNVPFVTDTGAHLRLSAGYLGAKQESTSNDIVISPLIGWLVVDDSKPPKEPAGAE